MTGHGHSQGRGSLITFLINQVRSLSRAGSHREPLVCEDTSRSPSNLSCDPFHQLPAISEPTPTLSHGVAEELVKSSPKHFSSQAIETDNARSNSLRTEKQPKTRPRSWFSFSRSSLQVLPARSKSLRLSKSSEPSGISRSAISAPVLTSTSNRKIADEEGIVSGVISAVDAKNLAQVHHGTPGKNVGDTSLRQPRVRSERWKSLRLLGSSRKKAQDKRFVAGPENQDNMENVAGDSPRFSVIENGIARRRTETMNLCRKKINRLTGHGHIKRKSIQRDCARVNSSALQSPLFSKNTDTEKNEYLSLNSDSASDLGFGSLSRSFASAVNKLDFHSPSTSSMRLVKSKSSIFNIKHRSKKGTEDDGNKDTNPQVGRTAAGASDNKLPMTAALKQRVHPDHTTQLSTVDSDPEPVEFSAKENAYVPAQPVPHYPRGVNPLRMHTDPMSFASAPAHVTGLPKPPRHTPTVEEVLQAQKEEDEEEDAIEDAPIYSPSLGDLSQYARRTLVSSKPSPSSGPHVDPNLSVHHLEDEKRYTARPSLRKSNSGLSLLSRFHRGPKDQSGPLHSHDMNQKTTEASHAGHLKQSSSTYLNSLFKKREMTPIVESPTREAASTSYQHVQSSPLQQHDPQIKRNLGECLTPPNPQKRNVPRGSITPQEKAKRRGIVGMPTENWSDRMEEELGNDEGDAGHDGRSPFMLPKN